MDFTGEMIAPAAVTAGVSLATKKAVFQHFGSVAERVYGLSAGEVIERLTERERLGSTGFGKGAAIPHGKIPGLDRIVAMVVRLDTAIDYASIDEMPVDIIFCLLSPPDAGAAHLKALAQVSRWLRDPIFVAKLRGAASADALLALLQPVPETRNAA